MEKKKICMSGLGYIGLPTAALLANRGYQVHGIDVKQEVVDIINTGKIHIVEPGLDAFVKSAIQSKNLIADTKPTEADIFMIAVPTPVGRNTEPDISYVLNATEAIAPYIREDNLIILESTSPVGTTVKVKEIIKKQSGLTENQVHIAYCPERVLPGQTMRELVENDRIVGGITDEAAHRVKSFYDTFVQGNVLTTNAPTAEMSKLTENSFRDVNIAFANELSIICEDLGIDVWELIRLANRHPRVNILKPGSGVGGHCIAVDPWFIVASSPEKSKIIKMAREINDYKPNWVIEKVDNAVNEFIDNNGAKPKIACMGIAFKPDIDDLRESPSLEIAQKLSLKYDAYIVEPNIESHPEFNLISCDEAAEKADIILFLVSHKQFKNLHLSDDKYIIDICGVLNPHNK